MAELIGDDGLTNKERNDCRDAFDKFDKDASGAISDWELRAMLQCTSDLSCPRPAMPQPPVRPPNDD